jgi:hypothetical protein
MPFGIGNVQLAEAMVPLVTLELIFASIMNQLSLFSTHYYIESFVPFMHKKRSVV